MGKPTIFISYSHKDEVWKDRLKPHLEVLETAGRISIWDDRGIGRTGFALIDDIVVRIPIFGFLKIFMTT